MISTEQLSDTVRAYHLLTGLNQDHLRKLLAIAREARFAIDQVIFREGARSNDLYLITSGSVVLEIAATSLPVLVQTIHAGEAIGWSALSDDGRTHFQARALSPTTAVAFDGTALRAICDADPALGYILTKRLLALVTERLDATRLQLVDMYASPTKSRS